MEGLQVAGELKEPLQQYSGLPKASQALLQPPWTLSSLGQLLFKSVTHPVGAQAPDPPLPSTIMGML